MHIIVCGDEEHLAVRAATHLEEALLGMTGAVSLGLAGGSTPQPTYRQLALADVGWERVTMWVGDERWVPMTDPRSNSGMIERLLADHVDAAFLPFPYDAGTSAEVGAARYAEALADLGDTPRLTVLGMGDDGHTASLFPASPALEAEGIFVANRVPGLDVVRATATFGYLAGSDALVALVGGEAKAGVLAEVVAGDPDLPMGRLVEEAGDKMTFIVDAAAARRLAGSA